MLEIVEKLENRLKEIDQQLADNASSSDRKALIELNRERRRVEDILETGRRYRQTKQAID
jgi:protein subunit release factor A